MFTGERSTAGGTLYNTLLKERLLDADSPHLDNKELFDYLLSSSKLSFAVAADVAERCYGIARWELSAREPSEESLALLDYGTAVKHNILPAHCDERRVSLVMANPFDIAAIDDVYALTGRFPLPYLASADEVVFFINKYYGSAQLDTIASQFVVDESLRNKDYVLDPAQITGIQNAPAVRLLDSLLLSAVLYGASDIHIEPYERSARARFRVDGRLREYREIPPVLQPNIIGRLKAMCRINMSDTRLPQDGHFSYEYQKDRIDFRVSTMPTLYGEKAAIRLIYNKNRFIDKASLGFFDEDLDAITRMFHSPYGAVLVTGPTGSGKTTTLAGFVGELNREDINIVTVEDPAENHISGVNQTNVNINAGLDFDDALRSILRQDPDVVMIGEIRDDKTARTAIRAAIAGRLVLATLHTNDAAGAVIRLVNMNVEHYLVSAALTGVISQRLVRTVCPHCKEEAALGEDFARLLNQPADTVVYRGAGCSRCGGTGFHGRTAVYEYFIMDGGLRALLDGRCTYEAFKAGLAEKGMKTIRENAFKNVLLGNTTPDEMLKAVYNTGG